MQRRAAATYAAIFILVAAGAYAVIGLASQPAVTLQDPNYSLAAGDTLSPDARTYTVQPVQPGTNEGNDLRSTTLTWVNESGRYTETWAAHRQVFAGTPGQGPGAGGGPGGGFGLLAGQNATAIQYQNQSYRVIVRGDAPDPTSFFLVETRSLPDNVTTVTTNGTLYVSFERDGRQFVPAEEYMLDRFGRPDVETYAEGDTLPLGNHTATVASVTNTSVVLAWTAPQTNELQLSEGTTHTFGDTQYVAHFPDNRTLELTSDVGGYDAEVAAVETYHERINGFWGVSILSGLTAIVLLAAAYLPSRY